MSRKIHHGANGSYKTAGALNDDLMSAVVSGRTIVTNIRGLDNKDKIIRTWYELQPLGTRIFWRFFPLKAPMIDFELIHVDTECPNEGMENLEKMRRWMEWIPKGAFIIFDEIGEIYNPKVFTTKKLGEYDYPGGREASVKAGRWDTVDTAFQKHRHYNLDMIFTTTSMDLVHPMIKQGADMAYRHFNMANAGTMQKGSYREIAHSPENKGANETQELSNIVKRIPKKLFSIYLSTSTGKVQDTIAGTSLWAGNRKVRWMTYALVIIIAKSIYDLPVLLDRFGGSNATEEQLKESPLSQTSSPVDPRTIQATPLPAKTAQAQAIAKASAIHSLPLPPQLPDKIRIFVNDILSKSLLMTGNFGGDRVYFKDKANDTDYMISDFKKMGFSLIWTTDDTGYLKYQSAIIPFKPSTMNINDFCCLEGSTRQDSGVQLTNIIKKGSGRACNTS